MEKYGKVTNILNHPLVQLLGGGGIITVITWIVTHLAQLPIWQIWLAILFSVGCFLWIINQVNTWRERHKRGFATQNNEQIEDTLRKWLDKKQYSLTHIKNDSDLFCFVATDMQKRPVNVMRPKNEPQVVRLLLVISEEQIEKLSNSQQNIVKHAIGLEMARLGILWNPNPMYAYLDLFCDNSLTESVFIGALNKIRQSAVLASAIAEYLITGFVVSSAKKLDSGKEDSQNLLA